MMGIYSVRVEDFTYKQEIIGYRVVAHYRGWFEDNFEPIEHPALFRNYDAAENFAKKIKTAPKLNFKNWILPTSPASYIRNDVNPPLYSVI